jgi:translation initiation factor IF-3
MAHTEVGYETIKRAVADLDHVGHPDNQARLVGRNIIVMMTPLPANKRKMKYNVDEVEEEEAVEPAKDKS